MEAMVAERGSEMTEWNDGLLDERFLQIDQRFDRLEKKVDDGFARMDAKFDTINERFEDLHKMLFKTSWAVVIGLLGLMGVLIGLVGTQA